MRNEVWKQVIDSDGAYEVSDCGRVRSYKNNKWGLSTNPKLLTVRDDAYGYKTVSLRMHGSYKNVKVHRLVVEAFIGRKLEPSEHIDHLNTIRSDNRLSNLRICTQAENNRNHLTRKKMSIARKGKKLDLTDEQRKRLSENAKQMWRDEKIRERIIEAVGKPIILRGVESGAIYRFNSKTDASLFFDYSKSKVGCYIMRAIQKGNNFITLKGERYYWKDTE
jgi:hypothetical protein